MPKVTVIPASFNPLSSAQASSIKKRRVAGYARVSTGSEEQATSYEAQVDYYTNYIKSKPDWEFVGLYSDEGISATSTKRREGFKQMIDDALSGNIDLIVTKSVSRFARNTVDSLSTIRRLKDAKCECYFERENIFTFDGKGELLLTIMSSLAQEESRSISENVTWGHRKRFADGKLMMPYKSVLGYKKGEEGRPVVDEEQSRIVRLIYRLFLQGKTYNSISKYLKDKNIKSPLGKDKWGVTTIKSILTNEKYRGDALLQKSFTTDFLQKTTKKNEGEVPQYYVENSHPAIIDSQEWDCVQAEISRRKAIGKSYRCSNAMSSRLVCAQCGSFYGSKVWHSTDKYKTTVWHCNSRIVNGCTTPIVKTEEVQGLFIDAYNEMLNGKEEVLADCKAMYKVLFDTSRIDEKLIGLKLNLEVVAEKAKKLTTKLAEDLISQADYGVNYDMLDKEYKCVLADMKELESEKQDLKNRAKMMTIFIKTLESTTDVLSCWDEQIWLSTIESASIHADKSITFKFNSGLEVRVPR